MSYISIYVCLQWYLIRKIHNFFAAHEKFLVQTSFVSRSMAGVSQLLLKKMEENFRDKKERMVTMNNSVRVRRDLFYNQFWRLTIIWDLPGLIPVATKAWVFLARRESTKKIKCTRLNMNYSRMMIRYLCLATVYTSHMFKASSDQ